LSKDPSNVLFVAETEDPQKRIDRLNQEAWDLNRRDPQKALVQSIEAKELSLALNYQHGTACALMTMGCCYIWLSRNEEALSCSLAARVIFRDLGDLKNEAQVSYNMGTNFFYLADYDKSIKHYMQCYKISEQIGYRIGMADGLNGAGTVYYTIEENGKALDVLERSRQICEEEKEKDVLIKILDGLGETYYNLKKYPKALENYFLCLDTVRETEGSPQTEAYAMDGIGRTYTAMGVHEKALEYYTRSLEIRERFGIKAGIVRTYTNLGILFDQQGSRDLAHNYLEKALALAREINAPEWVYKSSEALAVMLEREGELKKALELFRTCQEAREEVRNEKATQRMRSIELQHRVEQSEIERTLLAAKNKELESYFNDVTLLSEIGQKIISSLSVEVILDTVHANVNKLMDASGFGIGLYEEKTNEIVFPVYIEDGNKLRDIHYDAGDTNRLGPWCFRNRKEVFINDIRNEINNYVNSILKPVAGRSVESLIYLPLAVKGKVLGLITVQSFNKHAYTTYQLEILRNMAVYAAIALENARIYESTEEAVRERTREVVVQKEEIERSYENTRLLSEIGQELTSNLNFETVFNKLHGNVNLLMDAAVFGVRIYHPDRNEVEYKFEIENGIRYQSEVISMDDEDNYSVWCIRNRKAIFINDHLNEYHKYTQRIRLVSGEMPHSLIFYPLMIGDRVLGVITIQSFKKNAFLPYHLDILKTLASYTAIALENASLYETLEEKVQARTVEVLRQKEIIEEKNKNITDSIKYAEKIQQALLPNEDEMRMDLPNSFVYYKPKDIVSGDFYWHTNINGHAVFAIADCTGHGVPGAFMSAICNDLMNQVIRDEKVIHPGHALALLDAKLRMLLKKSADQGANDGMDIALCSLDLKTNMLLYAGAHRPLVILRGAEVLEYKPTKHSIGGYNVEDKRFVEHEIPLEANDILYLFTDGYTDQFGGPRGKKFKYKQLRELLSQIKGGTMPDQRKMLDQAILNWRQEHEQVDDILLMGVRV
jgi:serine phosphatase RsbU (regulator of sigma subunit)/tetratricopeptide (TPR) repeat protein